MDIRQRQLEQEMATDAAHQSARLQELRQQALSGDADMPRASKFISSAFQSVRDSFVAAGAVKARGRSAKYANWIRALDPSVAAVVALREVINTCVNVRDEPVTVQVLATRVGRLYELEMRVKEAEAVNPVYMEKIHEQVRERGTTNQKHLAGVYRFAYQQIMKGMGEEPLSTTEHMQLGKVGLQACMDAGIVNIVKGMNSKGKLFFYELHPDVEEYLLDYRESDVQTLRDPSSMLMHCPPDPWVGLQGGGFLSLRRKLSCPLMSLKSVRRSEHDRLHKEFTAENMPMVFDCANYLQSIPFSLHKPTMDAILAAWREGGGAMGLPTKNQPPKPVFPFPDEWVKEGATELELDVFRRWKRDMVRWHTALKKWRGKTKELAAFVKAAGRAGELCWSSVFMDTRQRWYYRATLNPQGSDLAKSTLHFGEKKALGLEGLFWLKVAVATHAGFDKARFKHRARWTEDNWDRICKALDAPLEHSEVFGNDAPWCMFSAAWELRAALQSADPAAYQTGVPVHIDATCSGLQHFCAMLRDVHGGRFVNLFDSDPTFEGPKQDIYGEVMAVARRRMQAMLDGGELDELGTLYARFWLSREVIRDMAKKPVMTYVYGATLNSTQAHVEEVAETYWGTDCWGDMSAYRCTMFLAKIIFSSVEETVPAAAECMRWLQELTRKAKGRRMEWTGLTGFKVQHDYIGFDEERVKLNSCGVVQAINRVYNDTVRPLPMANAISPNFVHNLDSTHLTMTALGMKAVGLAMMAIHDSFGTHPSDVDELARILREAFVNMYRNTDILANVAWDNGVCAEPPTRGELDLELVLHSEFFFC